MWKWIQIYLPLLFSRTKEYISIFWGYIISVLFSSTIPGSDRRPSHFASWRRLFKHTFQDTFDSSSLRCWHCVSTSEDKRKEVGKVLAPANLVLLRTSDLFGSPQVPILWRDQIESYLLPFPNVINWTKGTLFDWIFNKIEQIESTARQWRHLESHVT